MCEQDGLKRSEHSNFKLALAIMERGLESGEEVW
jgi:hypothetical protein